MWFCNAHLIREVLGYLEEERQNISTTLDEIDVNDDDVDMGVGLHIPVHRTLPGLWLSWKSTREDPKREQASAVPGVMLCLRGVIELEHLIMEETSSRPCYVPLEYNEESGFAFLCDVADIQEMHERIRNRLCLFLKTVIDGVHEHSESLPPRL